MVNSTALLLVFGATIIGAFGSLFLKKGSKDISFNIAGLITNYPLVLGIFLYVFSSVFYTIALKYGELTIIYPMTSLAYIWVALISIRFLDEKMNRYKWIGIILIIVGVVIITR